MADITHTTAATRFSSFHIHQTIYKHINNAAISVAVLLSKTIQPGKHPVHVNFHGGGLITGDALFEDWFANYLVSFTHRTSAIIVLPNYRFVPESSGADLLEDIRDLWTWVDRHLADYILGVAPGIEVDLNRLLVSGDSSGGWCALHSVFELPEGRVKALLLQYPMVKKWCKSKEWLLERGLPAPSEVVIDEHLAQVAEGTIMSGARPPAREDLANAFSANQHRWDLAFGVDKGLHPIERVAERVSFPPSLIFHGDSDTSVNLQDCEDFVQRIGEVMGPAVKEGVRLVVKEGEEHGFEEALVEQDEPWLSEQLQWLEKTWLQ
ncbi:alpha/beta-hydrolase [Lizonia empirigonia]|nr:alpha/beta-hydrolase [Lizonia empirigonia]